MKYLATLRCTFDADDEVEAKLIAMEIGENAGHDLENDDTVDVTQIIPITLTQEVEPAELVNQLRHSRDLLIKTRIAQCWDLASWIDKTAWILEHRTEATFDLANYDHGAIFDRADELLGRKT